MSRRHVAIRAMPRRFFVVLCAFLGVSAPLCVEGCAKGSKKETVACTTRADCPAGWSCFDGVCWDPERPDCPGSWARCGAVCADLTSNVAHCGACGQACEGGAHAAPACIESRCTLTCDEGFADCDGDPSNGCEVDTSSNVAHCGACGQACEGGAHAAPACIESRCTLTCDEGFADCDGDPSNGCEVDTSSNVAHCGACGQACSAALTCESSRCIRPRYGSGSDGELRLEGEGAQMVLPHLSQPVEGTAGEATVRPASTEGFAEGQLVMLHQSRGGGETPTGTWRLRVVRTVEDDRLLLDEPLDVTFRTSGDGANAAQVLLVPQYTRVLVASGARLTTRPWDGSTGGVLALVATEGVVVQGGSIEADGVGYRAGPSQGMQGEGQNGGPVDALGGPNGAGGGTATYTIWGTAFLGGGGGHAQAGDDHVYMQNGMRVVAPGGHAYEPAPMVLRFGGGGGGGGWIIGTTNFPLAGGNGGGAIFLAAPRFSLEGRLSARGLDSQSIPMGVPYGGSGAGGTIWLRTEGAMELGADLLDARGGSAEAAGAPGRVLLEGASSANGSTRPPFESIGGADG